jgi:hypothetical protein
MIGATMSPIAAREGRVLLDHRDRRLDRAAPLVAQDHDQRHPEMLDRVFDAAERRLIDRVARNPDDEQLAETAAEQQFGRHARIGTTDQHRERGLSAGDLEPAPSVRHAVVRLPGEELLIALFQQLERLVRAQPARLVLGGSQRGRSLRQPSRGQRRTAAQFLEKRPP